MGCICAIRSRIHTEIVLQVNHLLNLITWDSPTPQFSAWSGNETRESSEQDYDRRQSDCYEPFLWQQKQGIYAPCWSCPTFISKKKNSKDEFFELFLDNTRACVKTVASQRYFRDLFKKEKMKLHSYAQQSYLKTLLESVGFSPASSPLIPKGEYGS